MLRSCTVDADDCGMARLRTGSVDLHLANRHCAALVDHLDALGWIADRLLLTAPDEEAAPTVQRTPIDDARDALVQVDAIDSVDALAVAVKALAKLGS